MTIQEAKNRLVSWASSQIGYREGENNWNKYAETEDLKKLYGWKPQNQPWCDTFVDTGFIECFGLELASKLTYQPIGKGSAACRYSAGFYSAHEAFDEDPEPGDQAFFFVDGGINHTGIVTQVSGNTIYVVEGNSSDMVARRAYTLGNPVIAGFGRPNWSAVVGKDVPKEPEKPKEETKADPVTLPCYAKLPMLERGSKGEYVRAMQLLLIGRGNSCGGYGADGDFGAATQAALQKFQTDHGLFADGICGNLTWQKLLGG